MLSSLVEGRVSRVSVAPGDRVYKGDELIRLSNPTINNAAEASLSAWQGAEADLKAYAVNLQNALLDQEAQLLQTRFDFDRMKLQLEAETQLHGQSIISNIEYQKTKLNVEQLRQTLEITQRRVQQSQENIEVLMDARRARVHQLRRTYERDLESVDALVLRAESTRILQAIDVELGQQVAVGAPLGKLATSDELYAELEISPLHAGSVAIGQRVVIDTRHETMNGHVERIEPEVKNNKVIVAVNLQGPLAQDARPQLDISGTVYLTSIEDATYVAKPAFVKDGDITSLFKLDKGGKYADRILVHIGRTSPERVQVLQGLAVGDRVIISDTSDLRHLSRIRLQ